MHTKNPQSTLGNKIPTAAEEDGPQVMGIRNTNMDASVTEKAVSNVNRVNRVNRELRNSVTKPEKNENLDTLDLDVLDEEGFLSMKESLQKTHKDKQDQVTIQEAAISLAHTEIPWFSLPSLPSEEKVYPKGTEFSYRLYNYEEILLLNNKDLKEYDRFQYMLKGVRSTGSTTINPLLMTWDDFRYVSTLRKLEAFGTTEFRIPYRCPFCLVDEQFRFTLDMIGFSTMKASKGWAKLILQQYPNDVFYMSPLTVGDVLWLHRNNVFYKTDEEGRALVDSNGRKIPDALASLAKQCTNHKFLDVYKKFVSLHIHSDIVTLESVEDYFDHGVAPLEFTCEAKQELPLPDNYDELSAAEKEQAQRKAIFLAEACGQKLRIFVDGGNTVFIPFRGSDEPTTYGIFFD